MLSSRNEQGNILLYAVIAVTFLAGLGMYLQKMSDPMMFQTNDTKKILTAEYLTNSFSLLLSEVAYTDPEFKKYSTACITPSENNLKENFATIINRYKNIYLFNSKNSLLASISRDGNFTKEQVNLNQNDSQICTNKHINATQKYTINPYIGKQIITQLFIDIYY